MAQCCHPVPGDQIIGYITRSRGVTVHRQDCYNVSHLNQEERLTAVEWVNTDSEYPVHLQLDAWDRVGLVRYITTLVADEKINITAVSFTNNDEHTTSTIQTLETKDLAQLSRILTRIEGIRSVISASRTGDGAPVKPSP